MHQSTYYPQHPSYLTRVRSEREKSGLMSGVVTKTCGRRRKKQAIQTTRDAPLSGHWQLWVSVVCLVWFCGEYKCLLIYLAGEKWEPRLKVKRRWSVGCCCCCWAHWLLPRESREEETDSMEGGGEGTSPSVTHRLQLSLLNVAARS